jgi:tetratricopeptide (TPR) repeat protein
VAVLEGWMMHLMVADRHDEAVGVAREALAMARQLGLREVEASVLGIGAIARITSGDPTGLLDLHRCVVICEELGSAYAVSWRLNLAFVYSILGDLANCFAARSRARQEAERFGSVHELRWIDLERTAEHYWSGRWDDALSVVDSLVAHSGNEPNHFMECECRVWRGRIRLARGEIQAALEDAERGLALARETGDPQNLDPALAFAARVLPAVGRREEAGMLLDELLAGLDGALIKPNLGVDLGVDLVELGRPAEALDAALPSRWLEAAKAFAAGDPRRAAEVYAQIGSRPDEAHARLEAARLLSADGRTGDAQVQAEAALGFYREVGATANASRVLKLATSR